MGVYLAAIVLPTERSNELGRHFLHPSENNLPRDQKQFAGRMITARVVASPASVVARYLGLSGGSLTLDAACASSLYALKLACAELQHYRADAMLTGGVSGADSLYTQIGFSQLKALSPSGRCAPFDHSADGLVVGEGAGVVVLKRLDDAIRDGDTIYAVIRGIGLSNDMRGNLLAPESAGQMRAMRAAYDQAGLNPRLIDHIECHGAGTPVGDATELHSLTVLWQGLDWLPGQCAIGSIKSMIGHLLTAAGAAGLIKTLLAMHHKVMPPSLNFTAPRTGSPLLDGPFRVQTVDQPWVPQSDGVLRAAVSAFGFGGINAHVLLESLPDRPIEKHSDSAITADSVQFMEKAAPIAIVGMDAAFGPLQSLADFERAVFQGNPAITPPPPGRIRSGRPLKELLGREIDSGCFVEEVSLRIGEFQIPPGEIPDILPQQLLMLKTAAGAMYDAGLPLREARERMGAIIGIAFDYEATNFHLRWALPSIIDRIQKEQHTVLTAEQVDRWLNENQESLSPDLNAPRTLGALGGIVASRIAREFRFGGPSFVVSAEEASGVRALEIGAELLRSKHLDAVLIGAVDLFCDHRNLATIFSRLPMGRNSIRPFDASADGTLPGEGGVAMVLKRLSDAQAQGDRIYAIIEGIGAGGGGGVAPEPPVSSAYLASLERCFDTSGISRSQVGLIQTHGSGIPEQDDVESESLHTFFDNRSSHPDRHIAIATTKPLIGLTGAAAGLISVATAALCLHRHILPPVVGLTKPRNSKWQKGPFYFPHDAVYWAQDRADGPRVACAAVMTLDGNCMHVAMRDVDQTPVALDRPIEKYSSPAVQLPAELFIVRGDSPDELIQLLGALKELVGSQAELHATAGKWYRRGIDTSSQFALSILAESVSDLSGFIEEAAAAIRNGLPRQIGRRGGVCYYPMDQRPTGDLVFLYPGSGNHHVGMGRRLGFFWPQILRRMDEATDRLKSQMLPRWYDPQLVERTAGWQTEAHRALSSDALRTIFGQVFFGSQMTALLREFGVVPQAAVGYSLGESAALFGLGAWPDRGEMLYRLQDSDLFTTQLWGSFEAVRKAWHISDSRAISWQAAVVNRTAEEVDAALASLPYARRLIVNTPNECVIGGLADDVALAVARLKCEAVYLEGVVAVHCDAASPVAERYRELHIFPTHAPDGIRFYSCVLGEAYTLSSAAAADSILQQALNGFDYPKTIRQAYADGGRIFVEIGPQASCTRMVGQILKDQPHAAIAANVRGEDEVVTFLKCLAYLAALGIAVDLKPIYRQTDGTRREALHDDRPSIRVPVGGPPFELTPLTQPEPVTPKETASAPLPAPDPTSPQEVDELSRLLDEFNRSTAATAEAHQAFLDFSKEMSQLLEQALSAQQHFLRSMSPEDLARIEIFPGDQSTPPIEQRPPSQTVAFSREQCLEFAVGSVANVLGPEFAIADTYKARVRLPAEPLMLVDRIVSIAGEKGSLGSGRLVTEHDVLPGIWYLDGGRAPVCISVEAGQADLFLSSYLGIDQHVKGERTYRLLDAKIRFHRGLPRPGETIRYDIHIDRFVKQGETYLFFFRFEGLIDAEHFITMTDGCAGFFTEAEVRDSGGIIPTEEDRAPTPPLPCAPYRPLLPLAEAGYDDRRIEALRAGDAGACFGLPFDGIVLPPNLRLPSGRMRLIHRILSLNPHGGRFGLGSIRAEADIHPDDWFLTCHFVDDMVMPGTLMYECCAHTLRVLLLRLGWITDREDVGYEPVPESACRLKCRGPVTPRTLHVHYEVEIKQIGYRPEPFVLADAHMYADSRYIVFFKDMSMQLSGLTQSEVEGFWQTRLASPAVADGAVPAPIFSHEQILQFAVGKPSLAFGAPYTPFDEGRVIARLPGPPYCFMNRITRIEPKPWELKPGGWAEAQYDIPRDAWYFEADRSGGMPFCVLLEIALQPCGWLAAYLGSALRSPKDLKFRNLGGEATLHGPVSASSSTLTMRTRLTAVSEAADMIIEHFDFEVLNGSRPVYTGKTYFGFFTPEALSKQVGLRETVSEPETSPDMTRPALRLLDESPLTPQAASAGVIYPPNGMRLPAKALRMIDVIDVYDPHGGPQGLGWVRGSKAVDPDEWFFKAHFYQDPVCPGSLGVESFLQLIKYAALQRWPHLSDSHRFQWLTGVPQRWTYRGQVIPANRTVTVDAVISAVEEGAEPTLTADGWLHVDGLCIYKMERFGLRLVEMS
jgi:PfaB family protein